MVRDLSSATSYYLYHFINPLLSNQYFYTFIIIVYIWVSTPAQKHPLLSCQAPSPLNQQTVQTPSPSILVFRESPTPTPLKVAFFSELPEY